jgi:protoporphyrinogen oxidase
VALALPAAAQAALLEPTWPHLADLLHAVRHVPLVRAWVGFATARALPPSAGFVRCRGARTRVLGATFATTFDPGAAPEGRHLVSVLLGGGEDPGALDLEDAWIEAIAVRALERALGGKLRVEAFVCRREARALPLPAPGHRGRMAALASVLAARGVALLGSHVTGTSVADRATAAGAALFAPLPDGLVGR